MRAKKEIIISSLLAISLALGLGIASLGLFGPTPPVSPSEVVLDVYTQKSGAGSNVSGGVFETVDMVSLYAFLTKGGVPVNGSTVTFTAKAPDAREVVMEATTNSSGIAGSFLSFLPPTGRVVGNWDVIANATVSGTSATDELTLQAETEEAQLVLFSRRKNGAVSTVFLPNETVVLEAQASYRNASMFSLPMNFTVLAPSGTVFLTEIVLADVDGVANVTFQIPWPNSTSPGVWNASAEAVIYEEPFNASVSFECELLPVTIDVFTQKDGYGQNVAGGTFSLNDTVLINAQIRDQLNKTASAGWLIAFQVVGPVGAPEYRTLYTDDTGTAGFSHFIPDDPSYVGTYVVYATADYFDAYDNPVKVIDTLTFTVTA
jgi:hypothetical protein